MSTRRTLCGVGTGPAPAGTGGGRRFAAVIHSKDDDSRDKLARRQHWFKPLLFFSLTIQGLDTVA